MVFLGGMIGQIVEILFPMQDEIFENEHRGYFGAYIQMRYL